MTNGSQSGNPPSDVAASAGWMLQGAKWMFLLRLVVRLATLINMVVLARLLSPEDFGVIAIAVATLGLVEVLADFSPNMLLLQRAQVSRSDYDTVFTLSLLRGVVLGGLSLLAAPHVAQFYDNPVLVLIFWGLAARIMLEGLRNPGAIEFLKGLDYRRDMIATGLPRVLGVVVAITLALTIWPDYRALLAGIIGGEAIGLVLSYLMHPFRPRLSLVSARQMLPASLALLWMNAASWLYGQAFIFVLGKTHGPRATSFYAVANDLAMLAVNEIAGPLRRALLPGFALLRENPAELHRQFLLSLAVTLAVAAPLAIGSGLVAGPAIRLVFGAQWQGAVLPLLCLAPHGVLFVLTGAFSTVLIGLGQNWAVARIYLWGLLVALPLMVFAADYGATLIADAPSGAAAGAALALSFCDLLLLALFIRAAQKAFGFRLRVLMQQIWRVLLALVVMALAVWVARLLPLPPMDSTLRAALHLIVQAGVGAMGYIMSLLGLWWLSGRPVGAESRLLDLVGRATARLRRNRP